MTTAIETLERALAEQSEKLSAVQHDNEDAIRRGDIARREVDEQRVARDEIAEALDLLRSHQRAMQIAVEEG